MVKMPGSFSDVYDQPTGQMSEAPRPVTTNSHPNEALQSDIVEPQQKAPEVPTECEIAILNYSWKVSRKDLLEKSGFFRALFEGSFKVCQCKNVQTSIEPTSSRRQKHKKSLYMRTHH